VNTGSGRAGFFQITAPTNTSNALYSETDGAGAAVYAKKIISTGGAALRVEAAANTATALDIVKGGIRVEGAGVNTSTAVFTHLTTAASVLSSGVSIIDNPMCNGKANAMLLVTPDVSGPPTGRTPSWSTTTRRRTTGGR